VQYLFILIIAAAGAYIVTTLYTNNVAAKRDDTDAVLRGLLKEKGGKSHLAFSWKLLIPAVLFGVGAFVPTGNLIIGLIVGVITYVSGGFVNLGSTKARAADIEAILVFAQTVFPLLASPLSRGAILDQSSVVLTPQLKKDLEEVRQYGSHNSLTQAQIMHLFAAMEDSSEIDLIMAILAISFDIGTTSIDRSVGESVVSILNESLDGLLRVIQDRQELLLAGKIIVYGGLGMLDIIMIALGGMAPGVWSSALGDAFVIVSALIVFGASSVFKVLAKPRTTLRLIDSEYVRRNIQQSQQNQEAGV
jgi:hypothetical protein